MSVEINTELCSSFEQGSLGVYHVKRFWEKSIRSANRLPGDSGNEWNLDLIIIDGLNLGIEAAFRKVYEYSNSFDEFEKWILSQNGGNINDERISKINSTIEQYLWNKDNPQSGTEPIIESQTLDEQALKFWNENGYVILEGVVPDEDCIAAEKAIWEFLGMDSSKPETWYKGHQKQHGIMVQLLDHPALAVTRENSGIRKAFEQLWSTTNLVVSYDRVSFNPPETSRWKFPGPGMHWDTSLALPIPLGLQGLLYLTDTDAEQGAFTCVPGFQNKIESWLKNLEDGVDPRSQDFEKLGAVPIAAKRGDFVLWHHALPHGSRPNKMNRPRIVQYIKWYPPDNVDTRGWI